MNLFMINRIRKSFGVLVTGLVVGLGMPHCILANATQDAFKEKSYLGAMQKMTGGSPVNVSEKIDIQAPRIAENGNEVPIRIHANLDNIEQISIFSEGNPTPLLANFKVQPGGTANIGTRVKLPPNKHNVIIALVKADGKYYKTQQVVKTVLGGC